MSTIVMRHYIRPTLDEFAVTDEKRRVEIAKNLMLKNIGKELEKKGLVQFFEEEADDLIYGKGVNITMKVDIMKRPEPTLYLPEDDGQKMCHFVYKGNEEGYTVYCTECKETLYDSNDEVGFMQKALSIARYCPHCGAKVMNNRNFDKTILYRVEE